MNIRIFQSVLAVLAAAAVLALGTSATAVQYTWNQPDGSFNWNNADSQDNWGTGPGGAFPNAIADAANLRVAYTGELVVDLNEAITIGTLKSGSGYDLTVAAGAAGSLTFDVSSGNALLEHASTSEDITITAPVFLKDSLDVKNLAGQWGQVIISGPITAGSSGAKTISNVGNAADGRIVTLLSGDISDGGGGTVAVVQNGVGTLVLAALRRTTSARSRAPPTTSCCSQGAKTFIWAAA